MLVSKSSCHKNAAIVNHPGYSQNCAWCREQFSLRRAGAKCLRSRLEDYTTCYFTATTLVWQRGWRNLGFFQPPQQDFSVIFWRVSDYSTTRQVCEADSSPHSSWVQDRWEGRQLLGDLLQPGSSSVHSSASCTDLAGPKNFRKIPPLASPLVPSNPQSFFLYGFWLRTQGSPDRYNQEWKHRSLLV